MALFVQRIAAKRAAVSVAVSTQRFASTYDAIVIGSGIIGSSISLGLARRGAKVACIDSNTSPGYGTTSYSSGICRSYYSSLESVKLSWEGFHYYDDWANHIQVKDDRGTARLTRTGSLLLRSGLSDSFLNKVTTHYSSLKIPYEIWPLEKVTSVYDFDLTPYGPPRRVDDPEFASVSTTNSFTDAVYFPETGYVSDPQLAAHNLATAAQATGRTEFKFGSRVVGFEQQAGRMQGVVLASGERVQAPVVVNAAGPDSSTVNKLAFAEVANDSLVSTRAFRAEVAYVPVPPGKKTVISSDFDLGVYWRPEIGDRLVIGGQEPDCDPKHFVDDPAKNNDSMSEEWTNFVYRAALRMPWIQIPNVATGIVSMYDVADDWIPIYDKTSIPGYYFAIGTSGNQFKNAGVVGPMMAELIDNCQNGADHDKNPLQFKLKYTGHVLDVSAFSRKRTNQLGNTSMSVIG